MIALFCFGTIVIKLCQLTLSEEIDGKNLKELKNWGTIYSSDNDILVQTVTSYKLIAYLDPNRTINKKNPQHVVDKEYTAKQLATVIDMEEEEILRILNKDKDGRKQVEFGIAGKSLSEITKQKIEDLDLPGIDFIESFKSLEKWE